MKRICFMSIAAAFLLLTGCTQETQDTEEKQLVTEAISADVFAMDTYMNLKVYSEDEDLLKNAVDEITALEENFSVTQETSDISRINQSAGSPVQVTDETWTVLQTALDIGNQTDGALDISVYPVVKEWGFTTGEYHVPKDDVLVDLLQYVDYSKIILSDDYTVTIPAQAQIDLGSVVKGYASDTIIEMFRQGGAESAIISLGGNVQALGRKPDGSLWSVGVTNPFSIYENMCVLQIEDAAVITSGDYERFFTDDNGQNYWHIIDPHDGYPADNGLVSVTIIGKQGILCDALSTALFVMGTEQATAYWQEHDDFEMILVTDTAEMLITEGIVPYFTSNCEMPVEVIMHG